MVFRFLGPVLGPIIGGFINQFTIWFERRINRVSAFTNKLGNGVIMFS
jgi:hypothetical protein